MTPPKKQRITVKLKTPNPLFEKWITEWRDKAKENNSKMEYTFTLALKSLRLFPLPLENGKQCKALKGFGDKLCKMLDDKLAKYKAENGSVILDKQGNNDDDTNVAQVKTPKRSKKSVNKAPSSDGREYIPQKQSGGYAILITLYEASSKADYPAFLSKNEITSQAQKYSDISFTKAEPGCYYTAWSSMKTLEKRSLVLRQGNPPKFSLTQEGRDLADKLYIQMKNEEYQKENKKDTKRCDNTSIGGLNHNNNKTDYGGKLIMVNLPSCSKFSSDDLNYSKTNTYNNKKMTMKRSASTKTSDTPSFESMIFPPNSFKIILLVDKQELSKGDTILQLLTKLDVVFETRDLKVGDFIWICRDNNNPPNELVLPYIIERKRMDDLGGSIRDGRFHEQKFRLKQSQIQNLIYLVEDHGDNSYCGLDIKSLLQGATNTQVQDKFCVRYTKNLKETAEYLACMSDLIERIYVKKTLVSCPKDDIKDAGIDEDLAFLMTFQEFNKSSAKPRRFNIRDMFIKQLIQISGVSVDKALAITAKYATPRLLMDAYNQIGASEGEKLLAKLQFGALKKCIGPATSRIIYQFFCNNTYT